jgi:hypothetical protein
MRRNTVSAKWLGVFSMYEGVTFHRTWSKNKILGSVNQKREEGEDWFE